MIGALGELQGEPLGFITHKCTAPTRRDQATTEVPRIKGRSVDVLGRLQAASSQELSREEVWRVCTCVVMAEMTRKERSPDPL